MRDGGLATWPTAELESAAKAVAAIVGLAAGAYAVFSRWWRRRRAAREMRRLEAKAVRYLLDAQRHVLYLLAPGRDGRLVDVDELARQKVMIDGVRDELWVMDGHKSERVAQRFAEDVAKVLTRTQRIRFKAQGAKEATGGGHDG